MFSEIFVQCEPSDFLHDNSHYVEGCPVLKCFSWLIHKWPMQYLISVAGEIVRPYRPRPFRELLVFERVAIPGFGSISKPTSQIPSGVDSTSMVQEHPQCYPLFLFNQIKSAAVGP